MAKVGHLLNECEVWEMCRIRESLQWTRMKFSNLYRAMGAQCGHLRGAGLAGFFRGLPVMSLRWQSRHMTKYIRATKTMGAI